VILTTDLDAEKKNNQRAQLKRKESHGYKDHFNCKSAKEKPSMQISKVAISNSGYKQACPWHNLKINIKVTRFLTSFSIDTAMSN
jgi:hypothetical protein